MSAPSRPADWDPRAPQVLADPIAAYDHMRRTCPVAHSDYLHHSVFRHADVMGIVLDHHTYGNAASRHLSVPNGMDPPEHTAWRRMIEPYFDGARVAAFAPTCREIAAALVGALPQQAPVELMSALAHPFAVQVQCAFMGWPQALHQPLLQWVQARNAATLSADPRALAAVATGFDSTIRHLLQERRDAGDAAPDDITTALLRETIHGRPLAEEEIVSILRNWTVGELGSIASSVGIIAWYLAAHPALQSRLRREPTLLRAANDEILRIHAPLTCNRRVPTRDVTLGGRHIAAGERLTLVWAAANRDEAVFGDPDECRLDRDPALNLLYGAGIHACPGAALARLELEAVIAALLAATASIEPAGSRPTPAVYPAGGHRQVELLLRPAAGS